MAHIGILFGSLLTMVRIVMLFSLFGLCRSFNIDTDHPVIYSGPTDSKFGFSISQLPNGVVVGAPEDQTAQPGVIKGGAVYFCDSERPDCDVIELDATGSGAGVENKTGQWLGASVATGDGGEVVGCAPRYIHFGYGLNRDGLGVCYLKQSTQHQPVKYTPCENFLPYKYCQAGMSVLVSEDEGTVGVGAPGVDHREDEKAGGAFIWDYLHDNIVDITELPERETHSGYGGYSLSQGDMDDDGVIDYVMGVPRDDFYKGSVILTKGASNVVIQALYGEQMGGYYGYCTAVDDYDGDGLDDIAVGEPFFNEYDVGTFDTGRVYVLYQRAQFKMDESTILTGENGGGERFGTSVSSIGDLNYDFYNDLAVGSPYAAGGTGAVYIFHGGRNGVVQTWSQVVYASELDTGLRGFGFSIKGRTDLDGNQYPDLAVGAYISDKAIILKSRPIIDLVVQTEASPAMVDLEKGDRCQQGGKNLICFKYSVNVSTESLRGKIRGAQADLTITTDLDIGSVKEKRVMFSDGTSQLRVTMAAPVSDQKREVTLYIKDTIQDKLSPFILRTGFELTPTQPDEYGLNVILNKSPTEHKYTTQVNIKVLCGEDNTCIPDLVLKADSEQPEYILGDPREVVVGVMVENRGEDAHLAMATITLPQGLHFINAEPKSISCTPSGLEARGLTLSCNIGNPLKAGSKVTFQVRSSAVTIDDDREALVFTFKANSSSPEAEGHTEDNNMTLDIPVQRRSDLQMTGVSIPQQMLYNTTDSEDMSESDMVDWPELAHLYEIRNTGPSSASDLEVAVYWPATDEQGRKLLVLNQDKPFMPEHQGTCMVKESEVKGPGKSSEVNLQDKTKELICTIGLDWCHVIFCRIGRIKRGDVLHMNVTSRVSVYTFKNIRKLHTSGFLLGSEAYLHIVGQDHNTISSKVQTPISPIQLDVETEVASWVIVLAVIGGVAVLAVIAISLWKCGFFKRTRPTTTGTVNRDENAGETAQVS